jgi:ferrous iron transport protein B
VADQQNLQAVPGSSAALPPKDLHVALCGNPNTGKTTLYNRLTGARAHVGNYPGITVEKRAGEHQGAGGQRWMVHDLPGTYSLTAHSPEEEIAHHALTGRLGDPLPDVVVVVLDASNLARNLLLLLQVGALGRPAVAALNMMDAAEKAGLVLDLAALQQAFGCPMVPMVARTGQGIAELEQAVQRVAAEPALGAVVATNWSAHVLAALAQVREVDAALAQAPQGELLWWLAADREVADQLQPGLGSQLHRQFPRQAHADGDVRRLLVHERYARIDAALHSCVQRQRPGQRSTSDRVDDVLLHPFAGVGLFLVSMGLLFQAVFAWATPVADAVGALMEGLSAQVQQWLPDNLFRDVLIDGVLAGVGGTLVFLPQILILFAGIALLEDSGYLARAAFLVDRLMASAGLPGKAFVPLLSSHACAVPGILAARTMADPRDRLLTVLIAPLMSCSARLPVYTLVTAAVFAGSPPVLGFLSVGGLIVAAMYGLGFALALLAAWLFRRTLIPGRGAPLLLEMPPYRWPRPRNVLRVLWDRGVDFTVQTGATIVALTVVLWALMTFPRVGLSDHERAAMTAQVATTAAGSPERAKAEAAIEARDGQLRLENSLAGHLGKAIEPAIAPLGFDWRIGIGLVGSLAAREVLVPVMAQIYGRSAQADVDDAFAADVGQSMARAGALTPLKGLSLMVFFAVAMQCFNTLATIGRETRSWKWALFALTYLNGAAWLLSLIVYQGGRALGFS